MVPLINLILQREMTLRQLKQTASEAMPDYKQTLRLPGCVPARLSLESDARFSASGAEHSFRGSRSRALFHAARLAQPITLPRTTWSPWGWRESMVSVYSKAKGIVYNWRVFSNHCYLR